MSDDFYKKAEEEILTENRKNTSYISSNEGENEEKINHLYEEYSQKLTQIADFVESEEYLLNAPENFSDLYKDLDNSFEFMIKYTIFKKGAALKDFEVFYLFQRIRHFIKNYNQAKFYEFDTCFLHYLNKEELKQCFTEDYFMELITNLNNVMNHVSDAMVRENIYFTLRIFITACTKSMELTKNFLTTLFSESFFKVFEYVFKCNMRNEEKGEIIMFWLFLLGDLLAYDEEFTSLIENPEQIVSCLETSLIFPSTFIPFCYVINRGFLLNDARIQSFFLENVVWLDIIFKFAIESCNSKERLAAIYCFQNITTKYPDIALGFKVFSLNVVNDLPEDEALCYLQISLNVVHTNKVEYLPIVYQSSIFEYLFETSFSKRFKIKIEFARLLALSLKLMNNDMISEFMDHFDHDKVFSYLQHILDPANEKEYYISAVLALYSLFEYGNSFSCKNGRNFITEMLNSDAIDALEEINESGEITAGDLPQKIDEMLSFISN